MDFKELKRKVKVIKSEADALVDSAMQPQHKATLEKFIISLKELSDFLDDPKNVEVLSDYDAKSNDLKDSRPLDVLCKDILKELIGIEPMLDPCIFDPYRPGDLPTTSRSGQSHVRHNNANISTLSSMLNNLF